MRRLGHLFTLMVALALSVTASFAQNGKLKIKVKPKRAYVFVDGKAVREGSQTISLPAGSHSVEVVNYGYTPFKQDVDIAAGKTNDVNATLTSQGASVSGPFAQLSFKGEGHDAILLNGKTPSYFVANVGSTNHDFLWHKDLFVPPGTYHVTVTRNGNDVWAGDVNAEANKKTTVDLTKNGASKTKNDKGLAKKNNLPRSKTGWLSNQVAIAGVTGSFSAAPTQINCGQTTTLTWQSAEAVDQNISNVGAVDPSGSKSVEPHATTTYTFTATGPGGTYSSGSTVNVNTAVQASINANPTDVHYRKIGDKVITQDSSTLTWQTSNADNVSLNGNKVDPSGSQTVKAEPKDTTPVPEGQPARQIDENQDFSLSATNVCGGSSTQTASLHITGSIEPIPTVTLQSIFYPTDYPDRHNPQVGLVKSQQTELSTLADGFKKYLEYDPDAKLSIEAYADVRGSRPYNQDLSERRVERIKQFLVDAGIPADKIQTAAYGKERPMPQDQVSQLEQTNPQHPPARRLRAKRTDWLAYNRRTDIILLPSGKKSAQFFPHDAADSGVVWQLAKPSLRVVEKASQ